MGFTFQGETINGICCICIGFGFVVFNYSIEYFTADYSQESEQPSSMEHFVCVMFLPAFHSGL